MKMTFSYVLSMMRIVVASALLIFICISTSTGTVSLDNAGYAVLGGLAVAVGVCAIGIFMTVWYSRRHGVIPEGAPLEPVDEFDVFRW